MTHEEAARIIENYSEYGCGYCHTGGNEVPKAFNMAISILRNKPRLLTKDDFENNPMCDYRGALPVWIEHKYPDVYGGLGYWGSWTANELDIYDTIRPWTSRPTTEMMEATPWERKCVKS